MGTLAYAYAEKAWKGRHKRGGHVQKLLHIEIPIEIHDVTAWPGGWPLNDCKPPEIRHR